MFIHDRYLQFTLLFLLLAGMSAQGEETDFTPSVLQVPDGFVVEVAAAPPLVKHPMMGAFDDRGRLFIAESAGHNLRRSDLEEQLPNFVRMIEDVDGDGQFDKSTIYADKMTFPQGALWHADSLYVASSGGIWRLRDTDDDGVADIREQIVNEFGYTGNAADVHGCFLGPCGRIYWCEGRHGHEFRDDGGHILSKGKAARIFSCNADGSDIQVHCGGGMDNPVEIDFTSEGEMLGTVNLFYRQRGDCLVHWMHGGVYPRFDQPQVVAEFKRTGDLLPPVVNLGHVAVSGTTRYRGEAWGADYADNFFITEFNTHKVVRAKLSRKDATFAAEVEEFLSSTNPDFHPTDVLEDADGSLLVIDTGGWFRIGCPTSQIAKPNILGAIYRIRRAATSNKADPRGRKIDWQAPATTLAALLDDERFAVRERAVRELTLRGEAAIDSLREQTLSPRIRTRQNAVWALSRIATPQAIDAIRNCLQDESSRVRQAAVVSLGIRGCKNTASDLIAMLNDEDANVQRDAATALGKLRNAVAVGDLLAAVNGNGQPLDRIREHALIHALIDINSSSDTVAGLAADSPQVRRAALISLDQMNDGNLSRSQVTALLNSGDLALQRTVIEIIARHPEWSAEVIAAVTPMLGKSDIAAEEAASARNLLLAFADNEQIQAFIATFLNDPATPKTVTATLLEVIRDASLAVPPESWAAAVARQLRSEDRQIVDVAVSAAERVDSPAVEAALLDVSRDQKQTPDMRVRAAAAMTNSAEMEESVFAFLVAQFAGDIPATRRLAAARAIGSTVLSEKQKTVVAGVLSRAGPLELTLLLAAIEGTTDDAIGRRLIEGLAASAGIASLSPAAFDRLFADFSPSIQTAAAGLRSNLSSSSDEQRIRLAELEPRMSGGDPRRGQAVFEGQRTACITCHTVQNRGGRVGPDLSTTGARRTTRDVLEAVLYPNSSLARGFETFAILMTNGKVHTGLILAETSDTVRIRTTQQTELTIRRSDIEELQPSTVSVMPTGLDKTMSEEELRDLVAYLGSLTSGPSDSRGKQAAE